MGEWRALRDARRRGRRDGKAGVPTAKQETLPFDLLEILSRGQSLVDAVLGRWTVRDRELEATLGDLEDRATAAEARVADAEAGRSTALEDHRRHLAEEDERLARLQTRLEDVPAVEAPTFELDEPQELPPPVPLVAPIAGGAPVRPEPAAAFAQPSRADVPTTPGDVSWRGIGPLAYWPLIALIAIGEIPLNAFAFRLFHEPDALTYAMTVTVAVALVAFAHVLGLLLARPERSGVQRVLVGVFIAVPLAAIGVISLVRYGYLLDVGGDSSIGPVLGMLAFGLMNLLVSGAAAGLSYVHHDPSTLMSRRAAERERDRADGRAATRERRVRERDRRELEQQRRREEELRGRLAEQERQRRTRELAALKDRHVALVEAHQLGLRAHRDEIAETMRQIRDGGRERIDHLRRLDERVDAARAALGEARRAVEALALERRALREATEAEIRAIRARRDRLAFTYCSANVRARVGHVVPACLQQVPALELPPAFAEPDPPARAA